jgi:hypothetical protein
MSEIDLDRLLDIVRTAIASPPLEGLLTRASISYPQPEAANDNGFASPLVLFPEGESAIR